RMHVALEADRSRVAEPRRHPIDRARDLAFGGGSISRRPTFEQRLDGARRPLPRSKIFGGELFARDAMQVVVHVGGVDAVARARIVDVLKQLVARQLLASPDDARQPPVGDVDGAALVRLPAKLEMERGAVDVDVAIAQRGEPERSVLARVLFVADANQAGLEEAHHGGQHLLAGEAGPPEIARDRAADPGQRAAERDHAVILGLVADLAPATVISILLAAPRVPSGGLDVAVRQRTD